MEERDRFKIHWCWVVLGSSFVTLFINFSIRIGAYSILLPEMIKDLQMTKAQAGMIKSAFSITYLLFAPLMGWLTDRIGGRIVISFFCLFLGGGTFLMGEAKNFDLSAIFFSIVGIGSAATWVPCATLAQRWFGIKKRGLALGILNASSGAGFGLMGLILPVIVLEHNWRVGWFILGISGLSLIILNVLLIRDEPEMIGSFPWGNSVEKSGEVIHPYQKIGYLQIFKNGFFWILGISYFALVYGSYAILDFIVTYGTIELKIPYSVASLFITVSAFSSIIGGILMMTLSDYIGRRKSLVVIPIMLALSIFLIICGGNRISLLMIGMGCFGLMYGGIFPMFAACTRDYFPKEVTGSVLGLLTFFYGTGSMLSPALTGYLADYTGTFLWPFGLGAFTSIVAAILIKFLMKPKEFEKGGG